MHQYSYPELSTRLSAAWTRGWTTLEEIIQLASQSPIDTDEAIAIFRGAGIQVDRDGDEVAWDDLSTLAEEGAGAFTAGRGRAPAEEELGPDSLAGLYIREINRTPLLTADDEVRLAQEHEAGAEPNCGSPRAWTTRPSALG